MLQPACQEHFEEKTMTGQSNITHHHIATVITDTAHKTDRLSCMAYYPKLHPMHYSITAHSTQHTALKRYDGLPNTLMLLCLAFHLEGC